MILNLANDLTKQQTNQQTYVASAIVAGGTSSPVKNITGLNNQWAVQFGQTGEETAEILIISGVPSGSQINFGTSPSHTTGTAFFGHALDTPIYQIHYDQIIFYRSTAGTGGPFSALATVSITPDSLYTQYNDTTGAVGYAYYGQYYNSVNGDLSGSSSIFVPGGPTFYSLQKLKQRAKDKLYAAGFIRNDDLIVDWINEWMEAMTNAAIKVNQGYLLGTAIYGFGTSGFGTITDTYFKQAVKMEVTYDGNTFTPSTEIPIQQFTESDFFNAFSPRHSWVGENVFEILPHNTAGSVKVTYAQRFTPLVNDSDEPPLTLKAYTTSCIEYVLSVAYGLDQKGEAQTEHFNKFLEGQNAFVNQVTPRDQTGPKIISLAESVSGLEDDLSSDIGDYVW